MKTMRGAKAVIKRMSILAVLLSGVILAGTSVASAQDCIRMGDENKTREEKLTVANRDCWIKKARSGEKDLRGAILYGTDLSKANLSKVNLRGAFLDAADLEGANLSKADLSKANLLWAKLSGANLRGAFLIGADLKAADLRGADLEGANLSEAQVSRTANARSISETRSEDLETDTQGVDFDDWKKRGGTVVD